MPNFKVSGVFCLEIEDVETPEKAKEEAFRQLAECLAEYPASFEVKVEEIPEIPKK